MDKTTMAETMMLIHKSFISLTPVKSIDWQMDLPELNVDEQLCLLWHTVLHPTKSSFPPPITYQISFLKVILSNLEKSGVEICDELYETYTSLLGKKTTNSGYKAYFMKDHENAVHLCESTNLISGGTTGLVTWQAAQCLVEWALENKHIITGKHVLELGSGLGFSGIVIASHCSPSLYTFSDSHNLVLDQLKHNVLINTCQHDRDAPNIEAVQKCSVCSKAHTHKSGQLSEAYSQWQQSVEGPEDGVTTWHVKDEKSVEIMQLDWEKIEEQQLLYLGDKTDVVLAADVVYDASIIPALVRVYKGLLDASNPPQVYIASTVRNEETFKCFRETLGEMGINNKCVDSPKEHLFTYDRTTPIQILQLFL